jgi:hypothetical protein
MAKNEKSSKLKLTAIGISVALGISGIGYAALKTPVGWVTVREFNIDNSSIKKTTTWSPTDLSFDFYNSSEDTTWHTEFEKTGLVRETATEKGIVKEYETIITDTRYIAGNTKRVTTNMFGQVIDDSNIKKPYVIKR